MAILHIIYKFFNVVIKSAIYKIYEKSFGFRSNEQFAVPFIADHISSTMSNFADPFFTIYYIYICYKIKGIISTI